MDVAIRLGGLMAVRLWHFLLESVQGFWLGAGAWRPGSCLPAIRAVGELPGPRRASMHLS
jgi:hypothetical protein